MSSAFSFGQNSFSFDGAPKTTAPTTAAGFGGFGAPAATAPAPAFSGFSQPRPQGAAGPGFSFGQAAPAAAPGFSFGAAPAAAPVTSTPFAFSSSATPAAAPAPAGGFSFGATPVVPAAAAAAPSTSFSFGIAPAAAPVPAPAAGFSFGAAAPVAPTPAASSGFSFGAVAPAAAPATTSASVGGFSFGNSSAAPVNLSTTAPSSGGFGGLGGSSNATAGNTGFSGGLGANPLGGTGGFGGLGSGTAALGGFGGLGSASVGFGALGNSSSNAGSLGGQATGISGGFAVPGATTTAQGNATSDQGSLASLLGGPSGSLSAAQPGNPTTTAATSLGGFGGSLSFGVGLGVKPTSAPGTAATNPLLSGLTATTTTAAAPGVSPFSFSAGPGAAPPAGGAPTVTGSISVPSSLTTKLPNIGASTAASTIAGSSGFSSLSAPATTAVVTTAAGASFGGLKAAVTQPAPMQGGLLPGAVGTTAAATDAKAPTLTASCMTYRNLEDSINKWTVELEEQEAIFLDQATQVNAWDRLLIDNADKITQLNTDVESVKLDQQHLDHELDFILAQQRELEDLLAPLEESVAQLPPIHYQQHADLEREHTYKLVESVDSQLKQMSLDLKEIVEHINASSSSQDSADPLVQITKILNSHMDSLNWIDQNTGLLQRRVEEVSRQANTQRAHQENNLRLGFK